MQTPLRDFQDKYLARLQELEIKFNEQLDPEDKKRYLPGPRPEASANDLIQYEYCYLINVGFLYIIAATGQLKTFSSISPPPLEMINLVTTISPEPSQEQIKTILDKTGMLAFEISKSFLGIDFPSVFERMANEEVPFDKMGEQPEIQQVTKQFFSEKDRLT